LNLSALKGEVLRRSQDKNKVDRWIALPGTGYGASHSGWAMAAGRDPERE
jgi:hypothetical protein